jgi:O-antigen ligase
LLSLAGAVGVYASVVMLRERVRPRAVVAAALVIGASISMAAWIGGSEIWSRYETLGGLGEEPSFRHRLAATRQTLGMATDFPWFGTGLGTFEQAFYLYTPGTSSKILKRTHNDYAQLVAESGLLGAVAMLWGLFVLVRRAVFPGLVRKGSPLRWPVRGVAVGVLALLLHSFVDFNLQIYSNSLLFVFLCALLLRAQGDPLVEQEDRREAA